MISNSHHQLGYVYVPRRECFGSRRTGSDSAPAGQLEAPKKLNLMVCMLRMLGVLWFDRWLPLKWFLIIFCHSVILQDILYQAGVLIGLIALEKNHANNYTGKFLHFGTLIHAIHALLSIQTILWKQKQLLVDIHRQCAGQRCLAYCLYVVVQDVIMYVLNALYSFTVSSYVSIWELLYESYYIVSSAYVFYHAQNTVPWLVITCISLADREIRSVNAKLERRNGDCAALVRKFRNTVDLCCANSSELALIVYSNIVLHVCFRVTTFSLIIFPCIHGSPHYDVPAFIIPAVAAYLTYVLATNVVQILLMSRAAEKFQSTCRITRKLIRQIRLEKNTDNDELLYAFNLFSKALGLRVPVLGLLGYKVMMSLLGTIFSWIVICYQMSYSDMSCRFPRVNATFAAPPNKTENPA